MPMDLTRIKSGRQDEHFFHLQHKDRGALQIAKKGLSPSLRKQLEAFCGGAKAQRFDEGGTVEAPAPKPSWQEVLATIQRDARAELERSRPVPRDGKIHETRTLHWGKDGPYQLIEARARGTGAEETDKEEETPSPVPPSTDGAAPKTPLRLLDRELQPPVPVPTLPWNWGLVPPNGGNIGDLLFPNKLRLQLPDLLRKDAPAGGGSEEVQRFQEGGTVLRARVPKHARARPPSWQQVLATIQRDAQAELERKRSVPHDGKVYETRTLRWGPDGPYVFVDARGYGAGPENTGNHEQDQNTVPASADPSGPIHETRTLRMGPDGPYWLIEASNSEGGPASPSTNQIGPIPVPKGAKVLDDGLRPPVPISPPPANSGATTPIERRLKGSLLPTQPLSPPPSMPLWMPVPNQQQTFQTGGRVPGRAPVAGDSPRNDVVPAMLSPGEVVIPRSIADDPEAAANFIRTIKARRKGA